MTRKICIVLAVIAAAAAFVVAPANNSPGTYGGGRTLACDHAYSSVGNWC